MKWFMKEKKKKCTFSFGMKYIDNLNILSIKYGITKSSMLQHLIEEEYKKCFSKNGD